MDKANGIDGPEFLQRIMLLAIVCNFPGNFQIMATNRTKKELHLWIWLGVKVCGYVLFDSLPIFSNFSRLD
jgi:hypothetical protein